MSVTRLRVEEAVTGGPLNLGGDLSAFGFGTGHVGQIFLKNAADSIQVTLDAAGLSGTGGNKMLVIEGSVEIKGTLLADTDAIITDDLTVNGNSVLGNEVDVDSTTVNGLFIVNTGTTGAFLNAIFKAGSSSTQEFKIQDSLGADKFTVEMNTGNVFVAGTISAPNLALPGFHQKATFNTVGSWLGDVLSLAISNGALGDGIIPSNIFLGNSGSVDNGIPIFITKAGVALTPGVSEDYTIAAPSSTVDITFLETPTSSAKILVYFGKKS